MRIAVGVALVLSAASARASWTQFALPTLSGPYSPYAMAHLADGRCLYAEGGQFHLQSAFGSSTFAPFAGEPAGVDPSFIAVRHDGLAVAGAGGFFGPSALYTFNPANPSSPAFTAAGAAVQNFQGFFRDDGGLYVSGLYMGFTHGVRYVALDGSIGKVIIENIATYSAGAAMDASGNLYVGDTDDGKVYRFSASQLALAIGGAALTVADGEFIHDFGGGGNIGTLAVDGFGNVWAAGYLHNGLRVFNPNLGQESTYIPALDNANYAVATFMRNGESYVAYINQENPGAGGTGMIYGYELANVVPEPATYVLLLAGGLVAWWRWRRSVTELT